MAPLFDRMLRMPDSPSTTSLFNLFSFFTPSKLPPQLEKPNTVSIASTSPSSKLVMANKSNDDISISSVVCPSLAYSNTLFFSAGYNVQIIVEDNEPEERLLNRFRREVMRAGIIQESRRRKYFENKQDEKKRRVRDAAKRNRKRRPFTRMPMQDKEEGTKKKDDDDKDNWEYTQG